MKIRLSAAALLGLAFCATSALAEDAASDARSLVATHWMPIVSLVIEAVDSRPAAGLEAKYQPVVLIDAAALSLDAGSAFGAPIQMLSRAQVRETQRAYFVQMPNFVIDGDKASVDYQQPSSGQYGVVRLERAGGQWQVTGKTQMHSAHASRMAYGALFDGAACMDGTEMSARWNRDHAAQAKLKAGKAAADLASPALAVCPGRDFPEVLAFRSSKLALK